MELKINEIVTIAPNSLEIRTYSLSPLDIFCYTSDTYIAWTYFYTYGLNGNRVKHSLCKISEKFPLLCGRLKPCKKTRYAIEVDKTKIDNYGFCFTEQTSELSIAETILKHSQVKSKSANYPVYPDVPFFMDALDVAAVLRGEAPLFSVQLTHFKDGCAVNFSIAHLLCDGQRLAELCRDISQTYCGEDVADRDLERSYLWPDRLVKHYPFIGKEIVEMPRQVSEKREKLAYVSFPEESCSLEVLYFSRNTLDRMKLTASQFLPEGFFVSTNDVLLSFWWLLLSEFKAKKHPVANGTDLEIANTTITCSVEFHKYGINVVPLNYSGNARIHCYFNSEGLPVEGKPISELFSLMAAHIRSTLTRLKEDPALQAQRIMSFYYGISAGILPKTKGQSRGSMSNLVKTPILEVDFGRGPPALIPSTLAFPLSGLVGATAPAPHNGVFLTIGVQSDQEEIFKNSVVIRECAANIKRLHSDFTVEEVNALLEST